MEIYHCFLNFIRLQNGHKNGGKSKYQQIHKKKIKHKISIDFQLQNDVGTSQELSDLCDKDVYLEIIET